jgi:hypothetical protein
MTPLNNPGRRGLCRFKKRDIARAVNAARSVGLIVGRIDIDLETGKISIVSAQAAPKDDPLDRWIVKHGTQANAVAS